MAKNRERLSVGLAIMVATIALLAAVSGDELQGQQSRNSAPRSQAQATPPMRQNQGAADVVTRNVDKLRKVLPKGWTVIAEKAAIKVVRDEPVEWYNPRNLPSGDLKELKSKGFVERSQYVMTLEFAPPTTEVELAKLRNENTDIHKKMDAMLLKMEPILHKFDSFIPRNKDERKLCDEYKALKASLHRIPNIVIPDASVFLTPSVGVYTLFYSYDVEKQCRLVLQIVEGVFVEQADPSRATPEASIAKFADAVDARDEKAMLTCFGTNAPKVGYFMREPDGVTVLRILAALRLRDVMEKRFGREATSRMVMDNWLKTPETKRLRAARWRIEEEAAYLRIENGLSPDDFLQAHGIFLGWDLWDCWGWRMCVGVPASGEATQRQIAESRRLMKGVKTLTKEIESGKCDSLDQVAAALQKLQQSERKEDN